MDALLSTLIAATISALAFIAYRHPKGYAKIYMPLNFITLGSGILFGVGSVCYALGHKDATIGFNTLNSGVMLKYPELVSYPYWVWVAQILFVAYLGIFRLLPEILDLPVEDRKDDKPKDKVREKDSDA